MTSLRHDFIIVKAGDAVNRNFGSVSPRDRHTPEIAKNTSLRLTREDREAIHEISNVREANGNARTRNNDIMVDALWDLYTRTTGKTREDVQKKLPAVPQASAANNVTRMPRRAKNPKK